MRIFGLLLLTSALGLAVLTSCETAPPQNEARLEQPDERAARDGADTDPTDPMLSVNTLHPAPADYALTRIGTDEYPIPLYAKFLEGVRICLDPGHGGDAHKRAFKRGPTGVREAEMNLRVAAYLRDFLEVVGARVKLTRTGDTDLSLEARADTADNWDADIFISLHHNASSRASANFTTVWYHAGVDFRPSNLDLARYLSEGLHDHFALSEITDVPLKSDQLMYASGFGVLRYADTTAALTESSFFSNPEEEQRLRDPEYNLREAYALFVGLARYAASGLPRATLVEPADGVLSDDANAVLFELDDGLRARGSWGAERQMILSDTVAVRINGVLSPHEFEDAGADGYRLTALLPTDLPEDEVTVDVQFMNKNKNSVINPVFVLRR